MEIIKNNNFILWLSAIWLGLILMLGLWWLYLLANFEELVRLNHPNITTLIKWEGGTFLLLLFCLSVTLFLFINKDRIKTKSLQDFFASLTHELKTPLASIKLQTEVINNNITNKKFDNIEVLSFRLLEDSAKLENQMDKILQLSRLERGGGLNLKKVDLDQLINSLLINKDHDLKISFNYTEDRGHFIYGDEFAIEMIINNLLENSRIHSPSKNVSITLEKTSEKLILTYSDGGIFTGDRKKIGSLFYTHNTKKGSGIGLYLSKKLMRKMEGQFNITAFDPIHFTLSFKLFKEKKV